MRTDHGATRGVLVLWLARSLGMPAIWVRSPDRACYILGVKTWHSTLETVSLCLSDETLKVVSPFYLVSMPGEVKDPAQGVNV